MIERYPPELMAVLRRQFLEGEPGRLAVHVGNYLQWFGIAEVGVTTILAYVLGITDWERTEYLVRGMDARVKCERLRQATKAYSPLGPGFKSALVIFEQECIPLRNRVAHTWPVLDSKTDTIHFSTFGQIPNISEDGKISPTAGTRKIHLDDLFTQGMWLNQFASALTKATVRAADGEPLELSVPSYSQVLEGHQENLPKAHPSTSDKKPQKSSRIPKQK